MRTISPHHRFRHLSIACFSVWFAMLSLADAVHAQDDGSSADVRFAIGLEVMAIRGYEDSTASDRDVDVMLFRYEDGPRAKTAYPLVEKTFIAFMVGGDDGLSAEVSSAPNVGEEASAYTLSDPDLGSAAMVFSRSERYVIGVLVAEPDGTIAEAQELAATVSKEVLATDESAADVALDEGGASTGGIWGKLETVPSLIPDTMAAKEDIYVSEDELAEIRAPLEIAGLTGAVQRSYVTEAREFGDPDATPVADQPFFIVTIVEFSDADAAAKGFDPYIEHWQSVAYDTMETGDCQSIGDRCMAFTGIGGSRGELGDMNVVVVQHGATIFAVSYHVVDGSGFTAPMAIASAMLDRTVATETVVFDAEGTSEGGLWDLFPAGDDPLLDGFVPTEDQILLDSSGA